MRNYNRICMEYAQYYFSDCTPLMRLFNWFPLSCAILFILRPCYLEHAEEAEETRAVVESAQREADDAVDSVQPILDTLDRDLQMVTDVPVLQEQMGVKLVQIKSKSEWLLISSF